jgi:hypothetical protein
MVIGRNRPDPTKKTPTIRRGGGLILPSAKPSVQHWITEQTATGVILFDGEAASREDAFERYAQDAGYESYDQLRRLTGPEPEDLYYEERRRETRNPSKPTRCPLMNTRCLRIRSIDD